MAQAPASDQKTLLEVASLDRAIARLERDDVKHPLRQELGSLLNATAAKARDRKAAEQALGRAREELEAAERLSATHREQIADRQTKLDSGIGLTSRDLLVLQDEIAGLRALLDEASEAEFAALEKVEAAQAEVEVVAAQISALDETTRAKKKSLEEEVAALAAEADELRARRDALFEPLAAELQRIYEHARSTGGYTVIAMRPGGGTDAGITLSPVEVAQIEATPPDEIYLSEEYDCIIVRLEA
ncbi:MAG: hypothetical protein Q3979_06790 [Actinomycetaceae bacterium]|nr:hypothetical protein [Actinomycetaceae bacterium]